MWRYCDASPADSTADDGASLPLDAIAALQEAAL